MIAVGRYSLAEVLVLTALVAIALAFAQQVYNIVKLPDVSSQLSASSDSDVLARAGAYGVVVFSLTTGKTVVLSRRPCYLAGISPNGRFVCAVDDNLNVRVWDTENAYETAVVGRQQVSALAFSPDSKILAWADQSGRVQLWHLENGQTIGSIDTQREQPRCVGLSVDSSLVAVGGRDTATLGHSVTIRRRDGKGAPIVLTGREYAHVNKIVFSPDGRTVAIGLSDGPVRIWNLADGTPVRTLSWAGKAVLAMKYSPDGTRLAAADSQSVIVWDVRRGEPMCKMKSTRAAIGEVAFGKGGRTVLTAGVDGDLEIWDVQTGRQTRSVRGLTASYWTFWWLLGAIVLWAFLWTILNAPRFAKHGVSQEPRSGQGAHLVTLAVAYLAANALLILRFDPRSPGESPLQLVGLVLLMSIFALVASLVIAIPVVFNRHFQFSLLYVVGGGLTVLTAVVLNCLLLLTLSV